MICRSSYVVQLSLFKSVVVDWMDKNQQLEPTATILNHTHHHQATTTWDIWIGSRSWQQRRWIDSYKVSTQRDLVLMFELPTIVDAKLMWLPAKLHVLSAPRELLSLLPVAAAAVVVLNMFCALSHFICVMLSGGIRVDGLIAKTVKDPWKRQRKLITSYETRVNGWFYRQLSYEGR